MTPNGKNTEPAKARSISPQPGLADNESVLVSAAKAGDINAFESLVTRYERKIFRLAQHITQNTEDAQDVSVNPTSIWKLVLRIAQNAPIASA